MSVLNNGAEPGRDEPERAKSGERQRVPHEGALGKWFRLLLEEDKETVRAAWGCIVVECTPLVAVTARAFQSGLEPYAIQEITQMVFDGLPEAVKRSSTAIHYAEGWLKVRIRGKTSDWYKSSFNLSRTPSEERDAILAEDPQPDPSHALLTTEALDILGQLLNRLPRNERKILELFGEGYSHEEIGEALGLTAGVCKTLGSRGRKRLWEWPHQDPVLLDSLNMSGDGAKKAVTARPPRLRVVP